MIKKIIIASLLLLAPLVSFAQFDAFVGMPQAPQPTPPPTFDLYNKTVINTLNSQQLSQHLHDAVQARKKEINDSKDDIPEPTASTPTNQTSPLFRKRRSYSLSPY